MLNTYNIRMKHSDTETLICAETPSKAKYNHWLQLDDCYESFKSYLKSVVSCKLLRKANKSDHYRVHGDFERTKNYRGVPLIDYGTEVELKGKKGFIIGTNDSCNLDVRFDNGIFNCHPNYELVYFDSKGDVMYDFRKEQTQ